ncbi:MAG: hypothetical protein WBP27_02215, partial [Gemmiger qucibialis]
YFYNTHTAACRQWQIRLILRAFSVKSAQVCTAGADCLWKSAKYSMLAVLHFAAGTAHNGRRLAPLQKGGESHAKTSDFSCFGFTHSSHGKKQEPPPRPDRQVQDRLYFFWP